MNTHHGHAHGPGRPAFLAALMITLGYAVVELVGGFWSSSLALVSDAGHMFSDALALALAGGAAWLSRRPPGLKHSYGLARAEVIGATLNGLIMLAIIVVLVVEAVQRLLDPRPVMAGAVMLIATIGLLVNGAVAYVLSRGHHHDLNVRAALIHVFGDLVSSVAAVIAGAVIYFTGWLFIDPILSLVIAALILFTTLQLLRDTLHVLMEGVPAAVDLAEIGSALAGVDGVSAVHDLHVWSIGSARAALSAHVEIGRLEEWPTILRASQDMLRQRFAVDHVTLQPELSLKRPAQAVVTMWPRGQKPS
ncbi:MAG TPA: cation diffusion facilitator family transporter [Burkholderiales bacterium]|jgi:cobalt-zinc-cadmium efflux system protein|nr:cation diffusion facilitator family transporter [Burkholderiales bacterium]